MNIKVLVIVLLIILVVCAIVAFLMYLKKTKKETSEYMPSPHESLIKVICVFGILAIVLIAVYCTMSLLHDNEIEEPSPTPSTFVQQPTNAPTATSIPISEPTGTPEPTLVITVEPTEALKPTVTLEPTPTLEPTNKPTAIPTATPEPTAIPKPTKAPKPTRAPEPTATPVPTATPKPTKAPRPTATPKPTKVPSSTVTPEPTSEPTATPKPTKVPKPTTTPEPTKTPVKDTGPLPEDKLVKESMRLPMSTYSRENLPGHFSSEEELVDWFIDRQYNFFIKPVIDKYGYSLVGEKKVVNRINYSDWDSFWFEYVFVKGDTKVIAIVGAQGAQYIDSLNAAEFIVVISLEFQNSGKTRYKYDGSVYAWPEEGFEIFFKNFG